jgi:DNA recombination protein RmuC
MEQSQALAQSLGQLQQSLLTQSGDAARSLAQAREAQDQALRRVTETIERRLLQLQDGNEKKLEQMRATVDEKLHATLEQRLGESFRQVAERLELVHQGLGEMQGWPAMWARSTAC